MKKHIADTPSRVFIPKSGLYHSYPLTPHPLTECDAAATSLKPLLDALPRAHTNSDIRSLIGICKTLPGPYQVTGLFVLYLYCSQLKVLQPSSGLIREPVLKKLKKLLKTDPLATWFENKLPALKTTEFTSFILDLAQLAHSKQPALWASLLTLIPVSVLVKEAFVAVFTNPALSPEQSRQAALALGRYYEAKKENVNSSLLNRIYSLNMEQPGLTRKEYITALPYCSSDAFKTALKGGWFAVTWLAEQDVPADYTRIFINRYQNELPLPDEDTAVKLALRVLKVFGVNNNSGGDAKLDRAGFQRVLAAISPQAKPQVLEEIFLLVHQKQPLPDYFFSGTFLNEILTQSPDRDLDAFAATAIQKYQLASFYPVLLILMGEGRLSDAGCSEVCSHLAEVLTPSTLVKPNIPLCQGMLAPLCDPVHWLLRPPGFQETLVRFLLKSSQPEDRLRGAQLAALCNRHDLIILSSESLLPHMGYPGVGEYFNSLAANAALRQTVLPKVCLLLSSSPLDTEQVWKGVLSPAAYLQRTTDVLALFQLTGLPPVTLLKAFYMLHVFKPEGFEAVCNSIAQALTLPSLAPGVMKIISLEETTSPALPVEQVVLQKNDSFFGKIAASSMKETTSMVIGVEESMEDIFLMIAIVYDAIPVTRLGECYMAGRISLEALSRLFVLSDKYGMASLHRECQQVLITSLEKGNVEDAVEVVSFLYPFSPDMLQVMDRKNKAEIPLTDLKSLYDGFKTLNIPDKATETMALILKRFPSKSAAVTYQDLAKTQQACRDILELFNQFESLPDLSSEREFCQKVLPAILDCCKSYTFTMTHLLLMAKVAFKSDLGDLAHSIFEKACQKIRRDHIQEDVAELIAAFKAIFPSSAAARDCIFANSLTLSLSHSQLLFLAGQARELMAFEAEKDCLKQIMGAWRHSQKLKQLIWAIHDTHQPLAAIEALVMAISSSQNRPECPFAGSVLGYVISHYPGFSMSVRFWALLTLLPVSELKAFTKMLEEKGLPVVLLIGGGAGQGPA